MNTILKEDKDGVFLHKTSVLVPVYEVGMKVGWYDDNDKKTYAEGVIVAIQTTQNSELDEIVYDIQTEDGEINIMDQDAISYYYPEWKAT